MLSPSQNQQGNIFGEWFARSREARPFLRWAGGKTRFLQTQAHRIPVFVGNYLEPFVGAGAMFFHVVRTQQRPLVARLGDVNPHLIRCFLDVKADPDGVYQKLSLLQAGYSSAREKSEFYYSIRETHNARHPRTDSAEFIFLNRTCWNGLWRVNQNGRFNVPFGAPKTEVVIPSLEDLQSAAAALSLANLRCTSWEHTLALAEPGDFVFLDPPYFSDVGSESYRGPKYNREHFGFSDHQSLAREMLDLDARGISFMLTNSAEQEMRDLYQDCGFNVEVISMPRAINSKTDERQGVPELVVTPANQRARVDSAAVFFDLDTRRRIKSSRGSAEVAGELSSISESGNHT